MSDLTPTGVQLMHALGDAINASGCGHGPVLDVLLHLYSQLVMQFPCCHQSAEQGLALVLARVQQARALHHYSEQAAQAAIERAAGRGTH